jgi:hypothetical protein
MIDRLISFKVKPRRWKEGDPAGASTREEVENQVVDKEWTVAGLKIEWDMFLLIRSGEMAMWYPRPLCEVI